MANDLHLRQIPAEMEGMLREFGTTLPPEEAGRLLANTSNRSIALLYKLARDQAAARKGQTDWATWAKLANAARSAVLAASMCREIANNLVFAGSAQSKPTNISDNQATDSTDSTVSYQRSTGSADVAKANEVEGEFLPGPDPPNDTIQD